MNGLQGMTYKFPSNTEKHLNILEVIVDLVEFFVVPHSTLSNCNDVLQKQDSATGIVAVRPCIAQDRHHSSPISSCHLLS